MCGFVTIVGRQGKVPDQPLLERCADSIAHRGPDDSGYLLHGNVGMAFRRLSILDLAPSGHQPMRSADGRFVITFNGEIFNYVELRAELIALGHSFRSTGDTEVLLAAWRQWGNDCLHRLNGMWAFVILDTQSGRIFGARDRFGEKPIFIHQGPDWLILASEIKAIRVSGLAKLGVNWQTVSAFALESQLDDGAATFYTGVEHVAAGSAFEIDAAGQFRSWRYWSLDNEFAPPETDVVGQFAELFEDSVRLRMRSDVPVGVMLSGGMDSTAVVCSMARVRQAGADASPMNAFCFMAKQFDETAYIEATLAQTGARLHRLSVTAESLWDCTEKHLGFHDEPAHSATSVVGFKLMELARSEGVKVVLGGQGADESLAGYHDYFRDYWTQLAWQGHLATLSRDMRLHCATHGGQFAATMVATLRRVATLQLHRSAAYRRSAEQRRIATLRGDHWYSPRLGDALPHREPEFNPPSLRRALAESIEKAFLPVYLRVEDRNSMAHSVEARLPFMDYRLVSLAFKLADDVKLRAPWNKWILREAMRGRIPEIVRARADKFGFPSPVDEWLRGPWRAPMQELLAEPALVDSGICDLKLVRSALDRHARGEINVGARMFKIAQLALWLRSCRNQGVSTA